MKYRAIWVQDSQVRLPGWYVLDIRRSTPEVHVFVGNRHMTNIEAGSEARRLEIEESTR